MMASMLTDSGPRQAKHVATKHPEVGHVVVLGANGAMGYGSGALFTSAVPKVTFLARSKQKADEGLAAAVKAVRSATVADHVETGSYDDALFDQAVGRADLVFEALTEDFELKSKMFARVDALRRPDSIVATVTSGLSIDDLCKPRSESFRRHFLGLHLFNPPNVIVGTELVAGKETDPALVDFIEHFAVERLGRVVIRAADTPGFAGNRIGFKVLNEVAQLAEEHGPLLMDRLVGPYTGRSLAPLSTVDMVGWDIHRAICDNIHAKAPDEARATLALPAYMRELLAKGTLGDKSGGGFFKKDGNRLLVLDPVKRDYRAASDVKLPDLAFIDAVCARHRIGDYRGAMQVFLKAAGPEAALARKVVAGYLSYAFHRAGEVTASITGIDLIMGYGFNWAPPSVLLDTLGLAEAVKMIEAAALPVPAALAAALRDGRRAPAFAHGQLNVGKFFVAG